MSNCTLKDLVRSGQIAKANEAVKNHNYEMGTLYSYEEAENLVQKIFKEKEASPALVDAVLEAFLSTSYPNSRHGGWMHSLTHLTEELWRRRMLDWIKRLNEKSFKISSDLNETMLCNHLVYDFVQYAQFDDKPSDFGIKLEEIDELMGEWTIPDYIKLSKKRIATVFESEEELILWRLRQYENQEYSELVVDVYKICDYIQRLRDINADTDLSEFSNLRSLIIRDIKKQEDNLEEAKKSRDEWRCKRIEEGIQELRLALEGW